MEVMKSSSNVADSKQQQEQEEQQQQQKKQEQHFHVLAVDDSLIDRKLLERLLKGSSYKVTCVDSGDEALKFLGLLDHDDLKLTDSSSSTSPHLDEQSSQVLEGSKVINLIMTDYCMPGMSGYDLLKRLKGSSWKDIPVVVMSSENVPSRINMCLEEGAEEFLLKPLQISDLNKLQPYLLKSLEHHSTSDSSIDSNHGFDALVVEEIDVEDHNGQGKISDEINKGSLTMNNSNASSISKRKAVSTETTSERLPKMKGLVVA